MPFHHGSSAGGVHPGLPPDALTIATIPARVAGGRSAHREMISARSGGIVASLAGEWWARAADD